MSGLVVGADTHLYEGRSTWRDWADPADRDLALTKLADYIRAAGPIEGAAGDALFRGNLAWLLQQDT